MVAHENFVYLEIAETMRRLIITRRTAPGERLPSVRIMAERWRCTPNTVSRAYAVLSREGLVAGPPGWRDPRGSPRRRPAALAPPEWQWADLVNRAESYLLEAIGLGHSPAHAEAALAAAIGRWEEVREDRAGRTAGAGIGRCRRNSGSPGATTSP